MTVTRTCVGFKEHLSAASIRVRRPRMATLLLIEQRWAQSEEELEHLKQSIGGGASIPQAPRRT